MTQEHQHDWLFELSDPKLRCDNHLKCGHEGEDLASMTPQREEELSEEFKLRWGTGGQAEGMKLRACIEQARRNREAGLT